MSEQQNEFMQALMDVSNDVGDTTIIEVNCIKSPCNHCDCHWEIKINGIDVSDKIPEDLRYGSMNTENIYSNLVNGEEELFEYYRGGLKKEEWITTNKYWLDNITEDESSQEILFKQIQRKEFTGCAECGGCI